MDRCISIYCILLGDIQKKKSKQGLQGAKAEYNMHTHLSQYMMTKLRHAHAESMKFYYVNQTAIL